MPGLEERPLEQHMRETGHGEAFDMFLEGYKPPKITGWGECTRCAAKVAPSSSARHLEWHKELAWSIWLLQKTALSYLGGSDAETS